MRLSRRILVAGAVAVVASLALLSPSLSVAATTIGSDLAVKGELIDHNCSPGVGCTVIQTALPGRQLMAPFSGLIVRWRERNYGPNSATLRVASLLSSSGPPWTTSFLRSSDTEPTGGLGVVTFPVSPPLPIAAGDTIGISASDDNLVGTTGAPGATDTIFGEAFPADETTVSSTSIKGQNDDWLYNADIVGPPTSAGVAAGCPGGSGATVTVTADPDPATGAKAVQFRVDGGAVQSAATSGSPGVAALTVPSGVHKLEFWGEDLLGQQEATHHTIAAGCEPQPVSTTAPPPSTTQANRPSLTHVIESHRTWRRSGTPGRTNGAQPPSARPSRSRSTSRRRCS